MGIATGRHRGRRVQGVPAPALGRDRRPEQAEARIDPLVARDRPRGSKDRGGGRNHEPAVPRDGPDRVEGVLGGLTGAGYGEKSVERLAPILDVLKPHIFFDDQRGHLIQTVPCVHIPFGVTNAEDRSPQ